MSNGEANLAIEEEVNKSHKQTNTQKSTSKLQGGTLPPLSPRGRLTKVKNNELRRHFEGDHITTFS